MFSPSASPSLAHRRPGVLAVLVGALLAGACDDRLPAHADALDASDAMDAADTGDGAASDVVDAVLTDTGGDLTDVPESDADATGDATDADLPDAAPDAVETDTDAVLDADAFETIDGRLPVHVRFEPDNIDDFWAMPWPHDLRRDDRGHPILRTFPTGGVELVEVYVETAERDVDGFSTLPVFYATLDVPLDQAGLPDPTASVAADSPVQLLGLGDRCGELVPIEVDVQVDADPFLPVNALRASPLPGYFLDPGTTYAFVLTRDLGSAQGVQLVPPRAMLDALAGTSDNDRLNAVYAPLVDCLGTLGVDPSEIALAAPFTTQNPVRGMQSIVDSVLDPERTPTPPVASFARWEALSREGAEVWRGTLEAPIYQDGTPPYTGLGGNIVFDETGAPVVVRTEPIPFTVSWAPGSDEPLPVLVWVEGTGATLERSVRGVVFEEALRRGFAVVSFVPQFHVGRGPTPPDVALATYNYFNPDAGRNNFRQQAAETLLLVRAVRELAATHASLPPIETDRIVYGGHSQGGQVGSMLAGVTDVFDAYVLNGVGAALSVTVIERRDPVDIAALIRTALRIRGRFDRMHPIVQLVQLTGDVAEPGNYALRWPGKGTFPDGNHVLAIVGDQDVTTSVTSMNALAIAGRLSPIAPAGWAVDPFNLADVSELEAPFAGNVLAASGRPLTLAIALSPGSPHNTMQTAPALLDMAGAFWASAVQGSPPTVSLPAAP